MSNDWMTARIVHCNATLWRRGAHQWIGIGCTGTVSPISALPNPMTGPVTVVVDSEGRIACDLSSINSLDGKVCDLIAPYIRHDKHAMSGRNIFGRERPGVDQRSVEDVKAAMQTRYSDNFERIDDIGSHWEIAYTGAGRFNVHDGHSARWRS